MNAGKFEQIGTPQELYHAPATAFVAGFVGDSNRWCGRVVSAGKDGVAVEIDSGATFVCMAGSGAPSAGDRVEVFVRPELITVARSDERRVREELVSTFESRGSPYQ